MVLHYHSIIALPAESHEERVVGLRAVLDPSQKSHGRVLLQTLDELQHVQVLHRDPPEDRSEIDRHGPVHNGILTCMYTSLRCK